MYLRKYGELRYMLEKQGMKIGDMDMFIAATALEEDLILVTGNTEHFERIPGLKIENWLKE
jgi:tRNA(fMet)-specific endonuclease VapC